MNIIQRLTSPFRADKKGYSQVLGRLSRSNQWFDVNMWGGVATQRTIKNFIEIGYATNPYVFMVIDKISKTVAGLVYEMERGRRIITEGDIYDLWEQPNLDEYQKDFVYKAIASLLAGGNTFIRFSDIPGMSRKVLTVHPPQDVEILLDNLNLVTGYRVFDKGFYFDCPKEDMLHIKFPNIVHTDTLRYYYGLSPLEAACMTYQGSNDTLEAKAFLFKNKGITGLLSNETDTPVLENERQRIQKDFQDETAGAMRFGKILLTNNKLKYLPLSMSPTDMKMLELIIQDLRLVCGVYGVDSSLFNDPQSKTYNNRVEAERSLYADVCLPLAEKFLQSYNIWVIGNKMGSIEKIKVNTDSIAVLNTVNKDLSAKVIAEVTAGIITAQEARKVLGY